MISLVSSEVSNLNKKWQMICGGGGDGAENYILLYSI